MYTILLPTDGLDSSKNTIKQAMEFARALGAKVIGLHVVPEFHMPMNEEDVLPSSPALKNRADEEHREKALTVLALVEAAARDAGLEYEGVAAISDRIYEEIVDTAAKRHCDLIVMALHAHAAITASLIGSETAKVLTHTGLPVLVLH
jgi:nucleotide-binding universal stress UspA family protein